jgi:phosphoribosylformylglycinamidine cyclo-ligase
VIDTHSWKVPALYTIIQEGGSVDREEMYQVFNMGIGMAVVVRAKDAVEVAKRLKAKPIGRIAKGSGVVKLEF